MVPKHSWNSASRLFTPFWCDNSITCVSSRSWTSTLIVFYRWLMQQRRIHLLLHPLPACWAHKQSRRNSYSLNFADIESPEFDFLSRTWYIPQVQFTPAMVLCMYCWMVNAPRNYFQKLDWTISSLSSASSAPVDTRLFAQGDPIISGPMVKIINLVVRPHKHIHWKLY